MKLDSAKLKKQHPRVWKKNCVNANNPEKRTNTKKRSETGQRWRAPRRGCKIYGEEQRS